MPRLFLRKAGEFGLDPSMVKLNGHLISRGIDFVSSTVTWRSLLSFFSARGFSIGHDDKNPVIVDGKLCSRIGEKRARSSGHCNKTEYSHNLLKIKRLRVSIGGCSSQLKSTSKRKFSFEDLSLLKKLKINDYDPDIQPSGWSKINPFTCSRSSEKAKRAREDEVIVASPCKRIK